MKKNILGFLVFSLLSSFSIFSHSATFSANESWQPVHKDSCSALTTQTYSSALSACRYLNSTYKTFSDTPSAGGCSSSQVTCQTSAGQSTNVRAKRISTAFCPSNSTLSGTTCSPNSGFSAVNNDPSANGGTGSWSIVASGSECSPPQVYNSSTGLCTSPPTCTYPQFLGSDNTCQDPAPCLEGKITKATIVNYPPNPICVDGCNHNLIAPDFSRGLIAPSGAKSSCYKHPSDPNQTAHCDVVLKQTGESCFIPYNPDDLFTPSSPSSPVTPENQSKPLNNDGSVNYDGNPNTSGSNEPGSPTSGKNIDGTKDTDGDPTTTGTGQPGDGSPDGQPNPDPNNDHECPTNATWSDETEQCELNTQTECDPTSETCHTTCESGFTFDTNSDSCIPTESCDDSINSCISDEDSQNLDKLKSDTTGMLDEITKSMDEFDLLSYPTWFPQFQKTSCQPLQGQLYGHTISWDFCPYVEMINELIGWLMSLFTLWTVVQIGIKKD